MQKAARQFFDEHVQDEAQLHETTGKRPSPELIQLMGKEGIEINAMRLGVWRLYDLSSPLMTLLLGPGKHLHGRKLLGGVKGEESDSSLSSCHPINVLNSFNYLHELILSQEIARLGARGYIDGLQAGMWIGSSLLTFATSTSHDFLRGRTGLTPILNFGTQKQKDELYDPILAGKKFICLAISEYVPEQIVRREYSYIFCA